MITLCERSPARPDRLREIVGAQPDLDIDAEAFDESLGLRAITVAHNLSDWGATYTAIRTEATRHEITTLRTLFPSWLADDVADPTPK